MIIIVDGVDGAGKTVLTKCISNCFKLYSYKEIKPRGNPYNRYIRLAKSTPDNSIFDRFYICGMVYPVARNDGRVPLSIKQLHEIEKVLIKRKTLFIYANPSNNFMKQALIKKGESFITYKQGVRIKRLFKAYLKKSLLPVIEYKLNSFDTLINNRKICRIIKKVQKFKEKIK